MAIVKIIAIRDRLDKRVNYAINGEKTTLDAGITYAVNSEKTKQHFFASAINCESCETAYAEMQETKRCFGKAGGVVGYHFIQSFAPGEVTPEQAHRIGMAFAKKLFGGQYEAVIGTHLDKAHLHNHIVVNSVSFVDGRKYHSSPGSYYSNAIELDWDGSRYTGTVTDTNGVLSQYSFGCNIGGVTIRQEGNTLTVTATKEAAEKLDGYVSSEKGYSLDVDGTEAVLLEPSNGSDFQSCAALTTLPDPVWAYIQFKVNKVGSISVRKVDAAGEALAGAEFLLETSADGQSWTEVGSVTTGADGLAQWENLKTGVQYRITEAKAPVGYTLLPEPVEVGMLTADAADITITLCNNAGFELPFTGGTGFTTYFLLAALMLCMGVYFCKKSNIRKENN